MYIYVYIYMYTIHTYIYMYNNNYIIYIIYYYIDRAVGTLYGFFSSAPEKEDELSTVRTIQDHYYIEIPFA